jgi:hypothetical protein
VHSYCVGYCLGRDYGDKGRLGSSRRLYSFVREGLEDAGAALVIFSVRFPAGGRGGPTTLVDLGGGRAPVLCGGLPRYQ